MSSIQRPSWVIPAAPTPTILPSINCQGSTDADDHLHDAVGLLLQRRHRYPSTVEEQEPRTWSPAASSPDFAIDSPDEVSEAYRRPSSTRNSTFRQEYRGVQPLLLQPAAGSVPRSARPGSPRGAVDSVAFAGIEHYDLARLNGPRGSSTSRPFQFTARQCRARSSAAAPTRHGSFSTT